MQPHRIELTLKPRNADFAEKSGSFEQGFRVSSSVLNQGESITIEQYFTGYGNIKRAKVSFFPSAEIFDKNESYVLHSIHTDKNGARFGAIKNSIDAHGGYLSLKGMIGKGWEESTIFADINYNAMDRNHIPQLLSESKHIEAPITYHLKTSKKIKPGPYSVEFHFTYFNGDSWKTNVKRIDFKVQNFFEQHNKPIFYVGIFFALMGFLKAWIYPLFQ